ncbi:MAG: S-layer homology domain-containing protein [Candidatus Peribacteraceae bacterium]|nr:S-layer homology domain-containing protein [Candidatus Peribacteraceae bacterium]MDD5739518.1 S-layer homology domain-containing protein [Candidatus Peribacteraceae bacterium]
MKHQSFLQCLPLVTVTGCFTMFFIFLALSWQSAPSLPAYVNGGTITNSPFNDAIPDWAAESILSLHKQGIIRGYDDGRYGAGDPVTRGQVATLLFRILQARGLLVSDISGCNQEFDDVDETHFAFSALCILRLNDLAKSARHFAPDSPAPRAVTAAIMVHTLGPTLLQSLNESLDDVLARGQIFPDVSHYSPYYEDIAVVNETNIMTGYPNGTFGPHDSLNRAEAAVIMHRLVQWIDTDHISTIVPDNQQSSASVHTNGQCPGADLQTDPENCGWCGNVCAFDHAQATCIDGGCSIASCDFGWSNANYAPEDGCEEKWDGITPPVSAASSSVRTSSRSSVAARSSSSTTSRSASHSSASPLPDYTVENITAGPSGAPGGVIYQVTVGNRGSVNGTQTTQTSLEIWFNDDSHDVDELGVLSTSPVGTMSSRALFWTGHSIVLPGRHRIMACANVFSAAGSVMPESDRQNNCAAIYVTASGAGAGSSSAVSAGGSKSVMPTHSASSSVSSGLPSFIQSSSSSAGAAKSVMPTGSSSSSYQSSAQSSSGGAYSAPTQYQNSSSPMVQMLPNLIARDMTMHQGSQLSFMPDLSVTVGNTGHSATGPLKVRLYLDKEDDGSFDTWATTSIMNIGPGTEQQVYWTNGLSEADFVWVPGSQKAYFRVCADADRMVLESNERDNCTELVYDPSDIQ